MANVERGSGLRSLDWPDGTEGRTKAAAAVPVVGLEPAAVPRPATLGIIPRIWHSDPETPLPAPRGARRLGVARRSGNAPVALRSPRPRKPDAPARVEKGDSSTSAAGACEHLDDPAVHAPRRPGTCGRAGPNGIIAGGYSATPLTRPSPRPRRASRGVNWVLAGW